MQKPIDFIHIGYHKTGSSWLQFVGFTSHPQIELVNEPNSEMENFFNDNFWKADELDFDAEAFRKVFFAKIPEKTLDDNAKVKGISEENLTGHIYTGYDAKILADRIHRIFGTPKIIIVIRNQIEMIASLYNNYIKHGGCLSLAGFCNDPNMPSFRIFEKLQYDKLIRYYFELFGKEQVKVMIYEEMLIDLNAFMSDIFDFIGVEKHYFNKTKSTINISFSPVSLFLMRISNVLCGRHVPLFQKILTQFDKLCCYKIFHRKPSGFYCIRKSCDCFKESNKRLAEFLNVDLGVYGYPV